MTFKIGTPFARNAGYSWSKYSAYSRAVEDDVQTCPHCQATIRMRQWSSVQANGKMAGAFCSRCDAPTCGHANCLPCVPFIKKLEKELDMTVKLKQFLKDAGLEPAVPPKPLFTGLIKG